MLRWAALALCTAAVAQQPQPVRSDAVLQECHVEVKSQLPAWQGGKCSLLIAFSHADTCHALSEGFQADRDPGLALQARHAKAEALQHAAAVLRNVKLAAAWRGWLAAAERNALLKDKLSLAVALLADRVLALAWRAWQVCAASCVHLGKRVTKCQDSAAALQ